MGAGQCLISLNFRKGWKADSLHCSFLIKEKEVPSVRPRRSAVELPADETLALTDLLKRTIDGDRHPLSPGVLTLKTILAKFRTAAGHSRHAAPGLNRVIALGRTGRQNAPGATDEIWNNVENLPSPQNNRQQADESADQTGDAGHPPQRQLGAISPFCTDFTAQF